MARSGKAQRDQIRAVLAAKLVLVFSFFSIDFDFELNLLRKQPMSHPLSGIGAP